MQKEGAPLLCILFDLDSSFISHNNASAESNNIEYLRKNTYLSNSQMIKDDLKQNLLIIGKKDLLLLQQTDSKLIYWHDAENFNSKIFSKNYCREIQFKLNKNFQEFLRILSHKKVEILVNIRKYSLKINKFLQENNALSKLLLEKQFQSKKQLTGIINFYLYIINTIRKGGYIIIYSKKLVSKRFNVQTLNQNGQKLLDDFKLLEKNQSLTSKIKSNSKKNGNMIKFPSLAQKIIKYQQKSPHIEIKFPTIQKYTIFIKNYEICRKVFNVPQIIEYRPAQLLLKQIYIKSTPHGNSYQQCLQLISLLKNGESITKQNFQLPTERFIEFFSDLKSSLPVYNQFLGDQRLNVEEIEILFNILQQLAQEIDKCTTTFLYRDINLTNVLREQKTNKLYLIDYDNLCYGPYMVDLCFLLTDKFHYFEDMTVKAGFKYFVDLFCLEYSRVEKDFVFCCYFMCVRWLIKLTTIFVTKKISFHMNLKTLIVQLLRAFYKLCKFLNKDEVIKQRFVVRKLIRSFLNSYRLISSIQNLPSLPSNIILIHGKTNSQYKSLKEKLSIEQKSNLQLISIEQRLVKLRKKSINKFFGIICNDSDYEYIFGRKSLIQKNLNEVNKIILQSAQRINQYESWYKQIVNENNCIVCEVLLQILQKSGKIVLVDTNSKQIWVQLTEILEGRCISINLQTNQRQQLTNKSMGSKVPKFLRNMQIGHINKAKDLKYSMYEEEDFK